MFNDSIAAIATALSTSGISVIRLSGNNVFDIISKIFVPKNPLKDIKKQKSHTIHYGHIIENGKIIDEVLVSIMKEPNTFTKENIVEINCHGGIIVTQKILNIALNNGARLAEPGEFTKRAFLNGRIDLSQAEAVIDIINSKTELALKSSVSQLEGSVATKIKPLRKSLLEIIAHIEASIDYPEYDIEELNSFKLEKSINIIIDELKYLYFTSEYGKILREGLKTVIVGKPNVGKSSFLNYLLKEQKAIVTDIAGTTRDAVEDYINIRGIPIHIIDTAGIRETQDKIEQIGINKTKEYINNADLILFILDSTKSLEKEDYDIFDIINDKKAIILINKSDVNNKINMQEVTNIFKHSVINISVKTGYGMDIFEKKVKDMFFQGDINFNQDVYITNIRHKDALKRTIDSLNNVVNTLEMGLPEDCLAIDLKTAYEALGEIIGDSINEKIVDQIFKQFCLGK